MRNHTEATLWIIFSKYIRARDANYQGYVRCISCSTVKKWNDGIQAGHFIPRGSDYALKFNEVNVNGQCVSCNEYKSGNLIEYRAGLIVKYGEQVVKDLEIAHALKTTQKKLDQITINLLYDYYNKKFKELQKQKCL